MLIELFTLGAIALGLGKAKNYATGIGRIKRRIYVEIEAAQNKGVDLEQKFMELPNSQKISLEETGRNFGWKQSKRSTESGKTYAEAYFNSLKRAYNAISGIHGIGATPYTSHSVRNGNGHVILTWRDYAPAEEHVKAEAPAVTKRVTKRKVANEVISNGKSVYGNDWKVIQQNTAEKLEEFKEHLVVITNGLLEMAKAAGRFDANGNIAVSDNQILRETYNLVDQDLRTYGEWLSLGYHVRDNEYAYLFWAEDSLSKPVEDRSAFDVLFLYAPNQLKERYNESEAEPEYNIEEHEVELRKRRNKLRRSGYLKDMALEPAPNLQEEEPANTNYVPLPMTDTQQSLFGVFGCRRK